MAGGCSATGLPPPPRRRVSVAAGETVAVVGEAVAVGVSAVGAVAASTAAASTAAAVAGLPKLAVRKSGPVGMGGGNSGGDVGGGIGWGCDVSEGDSTKMKSSAMSPSSSVRKVFMAVP